MNTDHEREMLEEFIAEGWTAAELGEYARQWRFNSKTYPTAQAYQIAVTLFGGVKFARSTLAYMREPGYVLPPFDRPDPITEDDPENPEHSDETRADVEILARRFMARADDSLKRPRRGPEEPVPNKLWKSCFQHLKKYGSLGRATVALRLWGYR